MAKKPTTRRWGKGPRALASVLPRAAEPALRKRGFSAVEIITNWREIIGAELADEVSPDRLVFPRGTRNRGTLHITAPGAVALELQHLEPMIVERINTYFGYGAVGRLAVTQGAARKRPGSGKSAAAAPRPVNPIRRAEIEAGTEGIASGHLRDALRGLGKSIASARERRHENT